MRISNVQEFLGGANNLVADQIVNGAARNVTFTITDDDGMAVDLSGYTVEYDTIQATAPTLTPGRGGAFTVGSLVLQTGSTPTSNDALVSVADATNGIINLYIPADYYTGDVGFDSNTNVPCVVGNLRYSNADATTPEIGVIRVLHFIRYGVIATS